VRIFNERVYCDAWAVAYDWSIEPGCVSVVDGSPRARVGAADCWFWTEEKRDVRFVIGNHAVRGARSPAAT